MKDPAQIEASIERYRRGFWNKESVDRPPVGIAADRTWLPINYLKKPFAREQLLPSDVTRDLVRTDYEDSFAERAVKSDDWLPYAAAWRAVPWLEAICGCPVRYSSGSLAPHRYVETTARLREIDIPANRQWLELLRRQTAELVETARTDCWVSPSILRGPSDVLAAMRGLNDFFLDLYDDPQALAAAAARINKLHLDVLDMHFSSVRPKFGGYGHIFGYWAPGPTTVIQEDALGMCSPSVYRDLFMEHNSEIAERLAPYVLFHLHSTGYRHYRHVLEIPKLAGLQVTVEANGPSLSDLAPVLREILERSRLILFVDSHFDQLQAVISRLPKEGFYLMVSDKFVPTEEDFRRFLAVNWTGRAVD
jgi:hypothetical protein